MQIYYVVSYTCNKSHTVRLIKKFTFRTVAILSKYAYLRSSSYVPYFTLTPYVRTCSSMRTGLNFCEV